MAATVMSEKQAVQCEFDLLEVLEAGIDALATSDQERFAMFFEAAEELKHQDVSAVGDAIKRRLSDPGLYRHDVISAGLCPDCGSELETHNTNEHHPYGMGGATERQTVHICPQCGEL